MLCVSVLESFIYGDARTLARLKPYLTAATLKDLHSMEGYLSQLAKR